MVWRQAYDRRLGILGMGGADTDGTARTIDQLYFTPLQTVLSFGWWVLLGGLLGAAVVVRFGPTFGLTHDYYAVAGGFLGAACYFTACWYFRRRHWKEYDSAWLHMTGLTFVFLVALVGLDSGIRLEGVPTIEELAQG